MADANGSLVSGFARNQTPTVFSQLITWLSQVCPSFASLHPVLLRYAPFRTAGYVQ